MKQQSLSPFFVLGTQRSGSTLLTRMLSMHSELYVQNELSMWGIFSPPYDHEVLVNRINERMHKEAGVDVNSLEDQGIIWGWKDPLLTRHLCTLEEHFSNNKYILLIRDPRAVVASYIDNAWGLGTNAYTGALRWQKEVTAQLKFVSKRPDTSLIIRYEDLLSEPESYLSKICQFLGVDFEPTMLEYYKKPLEFEQNRSNVNTKKPLDVSSLSKWQRVFSHRQVAMINAVCDSLMQELGYDMQSDGKLTPNPWAKAYYLLHQKILGEIQLQYQLRKSRRKKKSTQTNEK